MPALFLSITVTEDGVTVAIRYDRHDSRSTHRVPEEEIRHRMDKWKWDLTVEEILNYLPRHLRRKQKQQNQKST